MKIGLWANNKNIFDYKKVRDNYAYRWYVLKKIFNNQGFDIVSIMDKQHAKKFDLIIENGVKNSKAKYKYLLMIESRLIRPNDWNLEIHNNYNKIFTWDDNLVDNKKYFKLNYAFDIPKTIPKKFHDKKLCCCISGNKFEKDPNELYSKRVEFVKWFENYHINEFDLYGVGWNMYNFGSSIVGRLLNKIKILRKMVAPVFPSYKGTVESKNETMKNYKFSICYENIKKQNGYITEKIFDCFFAGCIPIYWGAENISDYIPMECFIDKRKFNSYDELYNYIKNMDEKTYFIYLDSIEKFLNSSKADPFRATFFAETIVNEINKDLNGIG